MASAQFLLMTLYCLFDSLSGRCPSEIILNNIPIPSYVKHTPTNPSQMKRMNLQNVLFTVHPLATHALYPASGGIWATSVCHRNHNEQLSPMPWGRPLTLGYCQGQAVLSMTMSSHTKLALNTVNAALYLIARYYIPSVYLVI